MINSLLMKPKHDIISPPMSTGAMILPRLTPVERMAMISLCRERFPRDRSVASSAAIGMDGVAMAGRLYRKYLKTCTLVALYLMKSSAFWRKFTHRYTPRMPVSAVKKKRMNSLNRYRLSKFTVVAPRKDFCGARGDVAYACHALRMAARMRSVNPRLISRPLMKMSAPPAAVIRTFGIQYAAIAGSFPASARFFPVARMI